MNRKYLYLSLLSLSIAACSNVSHKQANGGFEYAKNDEVSPIAIPENLVKPKQNEKFSVPLTEVEGPIGESVDIRAPSLVLPIAASTRVEGNDGEAKVWFDKILEDKDLLGLIRNVVEQKAKQDNVELQPVNTENTVFDSTWYTSKKEAGLWMFKEVEETEQVRFRYSLGSKPHGRSVSVEVDVIEYLKTNSTGSTSEMNSIDKHRAEMNLLNQIIGEVDFKYREFKRDTIIEKMNNNVLSIGMNSDNDKTYIVAMETDLLWSNLPQFFVEYGFTVTDLDESKKLYFVDFIKPGTGFWANIWGDEKPQLNLPDGKYRFDLDHMSEDKTSLTLLDENGNPLSLETIEELLPVMEKGLSFSKFL